jgi:hypothetical protein
LRSDYIFNLSISPKVTKMRFLLILLIISFAVNAEKNNRAKRFAGFGSFSTVGGRVGCVVSENGPSNSSLYINSHFTKFLSEDEQQELDKYKEQLTQFKADVKTFLEERQRLALERRNDFQGSFSSRKNQLPQQPSNDDATTDSDSNRTQLARQPQPPKKPSFCSEKATTQYVFDGCSVQGDSVYIGENFVRKLTSKEQDELEQFDKQFTAYQKAVTSNFRQQVEEIFGKHFGQLFESGTSSKSQEASTPEPSGEASSSTAAAAPLEAPKTPNFCTLII